MDSLSYIGLDFWKMSPAIVFVTGDPLGCIRVV
jgi:hypothetical protein